jgi:hypothetical protein
MTHADGELENMAIGLVGCNGIAATSKFVVRYKKCSIMILLNKLNHTSAVDCILDWDIVFARY